MNNWIDKHSVNCYFCNTLVDERECMPADKYNYNDGGDICRVCLKDMDKCIADSLHEAEWESKNS